MSRHILIIDRDSDARQAMSMALRHAGYKVSSVFDEGEALSLLDPSDGRGHGFDLIIIDTGTPGAFGRRLADAMKHSIPAIPSLMVSNFSDKAFFVDLVSSGHSEFIDNLRGKNEVPMRILDVSKYKGKRI